MQNITSHRIKDQGRLYSYEFPDLGPDNLAYTGFYTLKTEKLLREPAFAKQYANNNPLSAKKMRHNILLSSFFLFCYGFSLHFMS